MTVQPWSEIVWPTLDEVASGARMTATKVKGIPAIGRGLNLIEGTAVQMPLDDMRGDVMLPRPRFLAQPDPDRALPWFIGRNIEDYCVHGNAVHLVTVRNAEGWPAAVTWLPAQLVNQIELPDGELEYWYQGRKLNTADVVHVQRGADPLNVHRGVGIVEQYMTGLGLLSDQATYERRVLNGSAVPSVAVTTPNEDPSQTEIDQAKLAWQEKFGGPTREPVILPKGTIVTTLAWSPADSQLVEARKLGLTDAANMLNMDAWWLGGESGNYNYKSPGPMWLMLLRQTVNPILREFEGVWSAAWLPWGREVHFGRNAVLSDDMETTVRWVGKAVKEKLITLAEGRVYLGLGAEVPAELKPKPVPPALAAAAAAADDEETKEVEEVVA